MAIEEVNEMHQPSSDIPDKKVILTKTLIPALAKISDKVTYILSVTVPLNTSADNLQLTCRYPTATQLYQDNATLNNHPVSPDVIPGTVTFPVVPSISACVRDITLIYTFDILVIDGTHVPPYFDDLYDSVTVSWEPSPGFPVISTSVINPLRIISSKSYSSNIFNSTSYSIEKPEMPLYMNPQPICSAQPQPISIIKEQKTIDADDNFTKDTLSALPGDTIYYRFTITLNHLSPISDIHFTDVLNPFLSFISVISVSTGKVTTSGSVLVWDIPLLDNSPSQNQAVLVISVSIQSGIRAAGKIINRARASYTTDGVNPVTYNSSSNSVIAKIPSISIKKAASPTSTALGDIIHYTINVSIPDGVVAPNLIIHDLIPEGQAYIPDSWKPLLPQPVLSSSKLIFKAPKTQEVGPLTLTFTFQTIVTHANFPPYTEIQTNHADAQWSIILDCPGPHVCASADVQINTPNLTSLKEQRNVSADGDFTTEPIHCIISGDTIEYRITLTNTGEGTAYNVSTIDALDPSLTYLGVVGLPQGNVFNSVPSGSPDGTLTWNYFNLVAGSKSVLSFQVLANTSFPNDWPLLNQTSTTYSTDPGGEIVLGPVVSNQVLLFEDIDSPPPQTECILVNKVYSQCRQSICFEKVQTAFPAGYNLINVSYGSGTIVPETLQITHIPQRPGFSKVTFEVSVPYRATFNNSSGNSMTQNKILPIFQIKTIVYLPLSRSESPFNVLIDTRSSTLALDSLRSTFAVGIIVVISVTNLVQLLIPSFGFCPDSCECEEYQPPENKICYFWERR